MKHDYSLTSPRLQQRILFEYTILPIFPHLRFLFTLFRKKNQGIFLSSMREDTIIYLFFFLHTPVILIRFHIRKNYIRKIRKTRDWRIRLDTWICQ